LSSIRSSIATIAVIAHAARTISSQSCGTWEQLGGNLLLDTRCNYYDQNFEWRKGINFCLKNDGDVAGCARISSKCWAVQSSDLVPVMGRLARSFSWRQRWVNE